MTAKEYLSQARWLDVQIDSKIEEVKSLHSLASKATQTLSDMPGAKSRDSHRMENIIVKILMLENEINSDIDRLVDLKNEIHGVVRGIKNEEYRMIIEKRYLNCQRWDQIAAEMGFSVDNVYKLHGKALKEVEEESFTIHH